MLLDDRENAVRRQALMGAVIRRFRKAVARGKPV